MCVSLATLTTYPSASHGTGVHLTVIVVAVLLTIAGREGVNTGADRITYDQAWGKVHWYLYLNTTCTVMKVLALTSKSFFHLLYSTCTLLKYWGSYRYSQVLIYCKYFEVLLILFIKVDIANPTKIILWIVLNHLQRRAKSYLASCLSLRLKSFLSRLIQTQMITKQDFVSPWTQRESYKVSISWKLAKEVHGVPSLFSLVEKLFSIVVDWTMRFKQLMVVTFNNVP